MKTITIESKFAVCQPDELEAGERDLVERAMRATGRSYAPYSSFHVGAAALLADGSVIEGSNQENAAYPAAMCAERTALFYANSEHPDVPVVKLAVAAWTGGKFVDDPVPPCGVCRQAMLEVEARAGSPLRILMVGARHVYVCDGVANLLPLSFAAKNMGM
ncbi:MAG TPA: cytidine deaminase [Candidatus Avibacteroides faecavium]|nr:cytidine deaminase [Candidatus Avibacteroides faecavium]